MGKMVGKMMGNGWKMVGKMMGNDQKLVGGFKHWCSMG